MEVHSRVEFQNGSAFQSGISEWKFRMEVHSRVEYLRGTKWPLRASVGTKWPLWASVLVHACTVERKVNVYM